jgi:succinate dehydrogenase / fumarate reductase cytochrome b subunit
MATNALAEARLTTTQKSAAARRKLPWPFEFYRSSVGKKWVMAVTGIVLLGFLLVHMIGNLKLYVGPKAINDYGEALRDLGSALAPRTHVLWAIRCVLIVSFALHMHASYALTRVNWKARSGGYSRRDYIAASYASRTMRWTGVIVGFFILFHLADLTWGTEHVAVGGFARGDVYGNLVASFERLPVAIFYVVANLLLGLHVYHGTWSLFQSLGWNHPRFNQWRRYAAVAFTVVVIGGNLSFPIAVQAGLVG